MKYGTQHLSCNQYLPVIRQSTSKTAGVSIIMSALYGWVVRALGEGIKLPVINGLGRTDRNDRWWSQPLVMGIGLNIALLYTFWRLFIYTTDGTISYDLQGSVVMSPIFSPNVLEWDLFGLSSWDRPSWVNAAILVLWIPFWF